MKKLLLIVIVILLEIAAFGQGAKFKNDQVLLSVEIHSSIYTYKVKNLSNSPIVGFDIPGYACYDPKVPNDWKCDISGGLFSAWTKDHFKGIPAGEIGNFSLRVGSTGASLGQVPAKIRFGSGEIVDIPGVWVPVKEPLSHMALVGITILIVLLGHSTIIIYKDHKNKAVLNAA